MGTNLARRVQENNAPAANGGEPAERPASLADDIRGMESEFKLAMPKGMEAVQLIRDALTCLRTTRKLAECDRASVLGGLMTCAQLGLRPGVLGHAWLLPFWDKNFETVDENGRRRRGAHRAQLVIGYQGYRELAQRSGQIDTLIGRTVHRNDHFDVDYGIADNLVHKPKLDGPRGEPIGYYTIVKYRSGGYVFWYMSKAEVEEHRDRYAMAKKDGAVVGPWRDNFDEMAVKTTFLRLAKWMPKSTELASAITADETVRVDLSANPDAMLHGERPENASDFIDGEIVDEEPNQRPQHARTEPAVDEPGEPASDPAAEEVPDDPAETIDKAPPELVAKLKQQLTELQVKPGAEVLFVLGRIAGRKLRTSADLTLAEAQRATELFGRAKQAGDPRALDALLANIDTNGA